MDQIADLHEDSLVVIRYHASWPGSGDPYYQYNTTENTNRIYYYPPHTNGSYYTPYLWVNGTVRGGYTTGNWSSLIVGEMSDPSPLDIEITGDFNPYTLQGEAHIRIIATEAITYSSLKLRMAITESNLYYAFPNGTNWHDQTFRDMVPHTSGTLVNISEGDTAYYTQSFSCPSPLDVDNCDFVAFVQSDNGRRILQGAKLAVNDFDSYFLNPFALISPYDDTTLADCIPVFNWHPSDDPDSGYAISYEVEISSSPIFTTPFLSGPVSDTSWQIPVCLYNDSTYYWRVRASNDHAPESYSDDVFVFTIDEGEVEVTPSEIIVVEIYADDSTQAEFSIFNNSYLSLSYTLSDSGSIISFPEDTGLLDTMETDSVTVNISSLGLIGGVYIDTIYIQTTHPQTTFLKIPVTVNVVEGLAYLPGDVNMFNGAWPPTVIGGDVTFLVNYFRGQETSQACLVDGFWCSADANGDCMVIGSDVTKMVNYFRGTTSITYCLDYEPLWLSTDDLPVDAPDGWPNCE
ncbi:MAG: Omp28-related outer membrane protein [candidate division Zixibacteria bacterium]|nr:Omp28-related outer membrane protein [candidate division Zixibacteria bacterium]